MPPLEFALIDNPQECESLWNRFSSKSTLYDQWDFRMAFLKNFPAAKLHFIVGKRNGEPVGLLPLQHDAEKQLIEFLGGGFMEDNHLFLLPESKDQAQSFFDLIQSPAVLRCIVDDGMEPIRKLPFDYPVYRCDLTGLKTRDDYIDRYFQSKSRANLKKKIRSILELDLKVETNRFEDLELMFQYNINTFGAESWFASEPSIKQVFRDLCHLRYPVFVHSFVVNGSIEAVSFSMVHNETYLYIMSGTQKEKVPNLGTYLVMRNIEEALAQGCTVFDAGRHDCNWKERWHLTKNLEYRFDFPSNPSPAV